MVVVTCMGIYQIINVRKKSNDLVRFLIISIIFCGMFFAINNLGGDVYKRQDLRDPDSLSFENAKKNLESGYKIDVTESVQKAEKHFEKLDEFLNN